MKDIKTPFVKGNTYWKLADPTKVGKPRIFPKPIDLWNAAISYFEWSDSHPIVKQVPTGTKVNPVVQVELQRPYTYQGMCAYLGICNLEAYKKRTEYSEVLTHIDNIIYSNKFEGAAVGVFNSAIIARDLGLIDKQENKIEANEPLVIVKTYSETNGKAD